MKNMIETLKRWKNWIRIKYHEVVTGNVQRFEIEDKDGKKQQVVVERTIENVCDHKTIREIAPTMWKCSNEKCPTYFQIGYKVMLTDKDLIGYLDQIATHLKMELTGAEHDHEVV